MAQHDYVIANGTGAATRADLNNGLAAIVSNNSGATEPATMYAYQWWSDTTTGLLKLRNAANSAWVTVGTLASANLGLAALASPTFTGTVTAPTFTASTAVNIPLGSAGSPTLFFTGDTNNGLFSPGADIVALTTAGSERFRIAASGQIGLGGANYGTSGQALTSNGSGSAPTWQTPVSTSDKISEGNTEAEVVDTGSDGHFKVTTEGSERFRVDPSGRLLVGTSTSSSYAGLASYIQLEQSGGTDAISSIWYNNNDALGPYLILGKSRGTTAGSNTVVQSGDSLGRLAFFGADGTDRGQWGAHIACEVDGTPGTNDMPGRLVFSTTADGASSPTERMRISQAGKILVNATSTTYSAPTFGTRGEIEQTIATYNNGDIFVRFCSGTQGSASLRGYIETNGVSVLYSTASDARLKENIADAPAASSIVDAVQVRSFDWKESGIHQEYGFVAQELLEVYPHAVSQPSSDDEERPLAVDYSQLVPLLVKEVQALRARVAALEAV